MKAYSMIPIRQVYYRIGYPEAQVTSEQDLRALREAPGPFVIQVFDKTLKLISEKRFEAGKYLTSNLFITKEGLYLSINHMDNPVNEEDAMQFEKIVLEES